jgi:hypothetical protein
MSLIEGNYYYYYHHHYHYHHHYIFFLSLHNGVNSPWTRLNYDIDDGYDDVMMIITITIIVTSIIIRYAFI